MIVVSWTLVGSQIAIYTAACLPTYSSRVELFGFMHWAQVCGINRSHSAGRLSLHGDEGLVTSICLASAICVAANGEPLGVSPRCAAIQAAAVGDVVVCRKLQPSTPRPVSLLRHATQTNLHGVESGARNSRTAGISLRTETEISGARFYRAEHVKNVLHVRKTTIVSAPVLSCDSV